MFHGDNSIKIKIKLSRDKARNIFSSFYIFFVNDFILFLEKYFWISPSISKNKVLIQIN